MDVDAALEEALDDPVEFVVHVGDDREVALAKGRVAPLAPPLMPNVGRRNIRSKSALRKFMSKKSPLSVVQEQLDAYNAKDIEALLETYAPNAEQYTLHGELLAKGHEQFRSRFLARFQEPNLHAKLLSRIVIGNIVTDAELITRDFPEGPGTLEMLCIYEVVAGHIQKASFASGQKALHVSANRDA